MTRISEHAQWTVELEAELLQERREDRRTSVGELCALAAQGTVTEFEPASPLGSLR